MEFIELVRTRHSVRRFLPREVEEEKLMRMLECARLAPSARNLQCWQYVVVRSRERITEVAKAGGIINAWLKDVPVLMVACADPRRSTEHNGLSYFLVDAAISMEHLVLEATELGLGTCWVASFDEGMVKAALSIPPDIRVVAMTPVGYPADTEGLGAALRKAVAHSSKRKALEDMVHWNGW